MESYLGIKLEREKALALSSEPRPIEINFARQRAAEVDSEVFEAAKGDQKKSGAARKVWWEMTDDAPDAVRPPHPGIYSHSTLTIEQEPIVPSLIAKELEERRNKLSEDQEAHAGIAKRVDGPNPLPGKPRSVFTFIDTSVKKPTKKVRA
ncbi:hypothetical protein CTheo_1509 [Ceratobasidium theobromae]|uniref:Uncharacterized protein n=1 Tax=Ceratobasidium theobromae TaxID=1582974 RepID=A0A5N5QTR8_9AGAM|nr:hypothetical protein CTheo_1509 [Ceratobasidium theobromae]